MWRKAMPPGATVRDVLAERGMTVPVFARLMGFSEARAEAFLCGDALLTPEIAAAVEKILGVPARVWRNLELSYRADLTKVLEEDMV